MYIKFLDLVNIRTFGKAGSKNNSNRIEFIHPDRSYRSLKNKDETDDLLPRPKLANITLLLGDNGSGKSTILRAVAASAFGPAARDILRDPATVRFGEEQGEINAHFVFHEQDDAHTLGSGSVRLRLERIGERLEVIDLTDETEELKSQKRSSRDVWQRIYKSANNAFFVVGYGATRRVERLDRYDSGARTKSRATRDLRVQSLFEDAFSLIPLASWLPSLKRKNKGRYTQVLNLVNKLIAPGEYLFTGKQDRRGDYLFRRGTLEVPFQSLSDGYRALIGWVADLLYHVCFGCPRGKKLVDNQGIVLVDEVDLHLHPRWQMQIVEAVVTALPNMQFIFTSHSPLVASSLEWMNIVTLDVASDTNLTVVERLRESIHGLDADQVLLTDFFGLRTTRASGKVTQLEDLQRKARHGDQAAARKIILEMARGTEVSK